MTTTIRVTGIEAEGRHGVRAQEREALQRFVVDLELTVEPTADRLDATADYRGAIATARETVAGDSVELLETLADRVAAAVGALPGVLFCRAVVHKVDAAARLDVGDISAEDTDG